MKKILFYGDSNTYGFSPYTGRYPKDKIWTEILHQMFQRNNVPYELLADGRCGEEIPASSFSISSLQEEIEKEQPAYFAVMLGSNDLLNMHHPAAETVGKKMTRFLMGMKKVIPAERIILTVPPAMKVSDEGGFCPTAETVKAVSRLADVYHRIAEEQSVLYLNTQKAEAPLSYDGVHLSKEGHQKLAAYLYQEMTAIL